MGALITAPRSTGLGDIEVYLGTDDGFPAFTTDGPTAEERARGQYHALAEVTGSDGQIARSLITTHSGYTFTQHSSVEIARRVLAGRFITGYQTPASAFV